MARTLVAVVVMLTIGGCVPIGLKGSSRYAGSPPQTAVVMALPAERN